MKTTKYFDSIRTRLDRSVIQSRWIQFDIENSERTEIQADGRIRKWAKIKEMENRYLRVILLDDGETVRNAFFDRGFIL